MRETRATGLLVQNLMMRNLSTTPARALRLAAIGLGIGLVMTVSAARAGDDEEDTRTFSQKFVDGVKAGFTITNMDSKGIDYRERSPLVVPPQLDLPPLESFTFKGADNADVQGFLLKPPGFDPASPASKPKPNRWPDFSS